MIHAQITLNQCLKNVNGEEVIPECWLIIFNSWTSVAILERVVKLWKGIWKVIFDQIQIVIRKCGWENLLCLVGTKHYQKKFSKSHHIQIFKLLRHAMTFKGMKTGMTWLILPPCQMLVYLNKTETVLIPSKRSKVLLAWKYCQGNIIRTWKINVRTK